MNERISIIIPSYNYAQFLPVTLRNILAQHDVDKDIIVVDDGSADNTEEVAASFGRTIRYVRQFNQGPSAARNLGMALAEGDYIMFLDSDDFMMPHALRSQLDCLKAHPEADLVRCATDFCVAAEPDTPPMPLHCRPFLFFKDSEEIHLCAGNFMPIHSLLLRRQVMEHVGRFDETLRTHEDHDYWFRCAAAGHAFCCNENVLALYRRHTRNASSQLMSHFYGEYVVRKHIAEFFENNQNAFAGERLEAAIAIAYGHLSTLKLMYDEKPDLCEELQELSLRMLCAAIIEQQKRHGSDSKRLGQLRTAYLLRSAEMLDRLRQEGCSGLSPLLAAVKKLAPNLPLSGENFIKTYESVSSQLLLPAPRCTDLSMVEPFASDAAQARAKAAEKAFDAAAGTRAQAGAANAACVPASSAPEQPREGAPVRPVKISVVMATFNAEKYLERALASVLGQTWPQVECIVQDGGSTDGTLGILRRHITRITHFDSAPDKGVYDAWNKALPHVSGDWVIFLGADDFFADAHVLAQCAQHLARADARVLFAYGALVMVKNGAADMVLDRSVHSVLRAFSVDMGLPFPATFTRASFLKKQGFDASYRIAGDFAMTAGAVTLDGLCRLPVHVTYMENGEGLSSSPENRRLLAAERARVVREIIAPRKAELAEDGMRSSMMRDRLWG